MKRKSLKASTMKHPVCSGIQNLNTCTLSQPAEVICFICDEIVTGKGIPLLMAYTPYSNTDIPTKIGQLMGDGFMVCVAVSDVLCKRCSSLINQLDKLECESLKVRTALIDFLKIKYQLGDEMETENINGCAENTEEPSQGLENHLFIENEGDSEDEQGYEAGTEEAEQTADELKYGVASQGIKRETLKIEDCGNVTDMKMVNLVNIETYSEYSNKYDESTHIEQDYEFTEVEGSSEYREMADDIASAITIYECESCSFSTPILDSLMDHLKSHSRHDLYKCSVCCQKFETQHEVKCHIKQVHGTSPINYNEDIQELEKDPDYYPTNQRIYECNVCKYHHSNKKMFNAHMRKHSKSLKFVCKICSKTFKRRLSLKKHMFSHKMFKCSLCSEMFPCKNSLELHSIIHNQDTKPSSISENPSVVSAVKVAMETNVEDVLQNTELITKMSNYGKQEPTTCDNLSVDFDQVEVLLEKMHAEEGRRESFSVQSDSDKNNSVQQKGNSVCRVKGNVNVLQPLATSDAHLNSVQVKELVENPMYVDESQELCDSFEDNVNKETRSCDVIAVLDSDCTVFENSEYISKIANNNSASKEKKDNEKHIGTIKLKGFDKEDECETKNVTNNIASKKVYVCSLCGMRTSSESHIKRHFKCHIALQRKTYKCHICERVLTTRSNLKRHISLHENCASGQVECNMCNEVLTDRLHLKHHMEVKHPESYQCSFCDRRFDNKRVCREHELTHPAFQCDMCPKMFLTEGRLNSHKTFMHSEPGQPASQTKIFKCHICHKILTTYHNLKRHLRNHEKCSGAVSCSLCSEELTDKLHLRQHVEEKHPENHQCSFCHRVFGNRKSCKAHEMTHPERFVYKCESCEKVFLTDARLKRHRDVMHRDPHCRVCGKEISNPLKLLDHERRHERHKGLFPCDQCPKIFRTPSGLKYHMSVHTGKYAVYCEICGKGLHSEVVLEEHKATHTKEVRYTCEKCGRTFSSNSTYRMHRLWHDNPLPYKCNICDRKFKHTSILAVHKRRAHTGERPYRCPHCNQTFSVSSTLNKHIILHTKEYPYRCKLCEKGFTTRTKIARHMAKVHNDYEMLNSKKKACEYKMVLHPSEITAEASREIAEEPVFISVEQILEDEKVREGEEETQAATLQVLQHVTVDPAQAAIFTIFQEDLPSSEFTLNEFDTDTK